MPRVPIIVTILLLMGLSGCISSPLESPLSSMPELTVYCTNNETKVLVRSNGFHIYDSITITIDNETIAENNTVAASSKTNKTDFSLNVTVNDTTLESIFLYIYNASVIINKNSADSYTFEIKEEGKTTTEKITSSYPYYQKMIDLWRETKIKRQ